MSATVLVVDHEALIRQSVRSLLSGDGFDVTAPGSGAEAQTRFHNAIRTSCLEHRVAYLSAQERRKSGGSSFVHAALMMERLLGQVEMIAKSPAPLVWVTGESGTGKLLGDPRDLTRVRRSYHCSSGYVHSALCRQLELERRHRLYPWPKVVGEMEAQLAHIPGRTKASPSASSPTFASSPIQKSALDRT